MPLPLLLALFSMSALGASDFLYKKAQVSGMVPESFLAAEVPYFLSAALLFGYAAGDLNSNMASLIYGPPMGFTSFIGTFCFIQSLRDGEVGVNTLILRLNFVLVAVLAVLAFGEPWSLALAAGLLCSASAIASVTWGGRAGGRMRQGSRRSILLALLAMMLFAALNLLFKIGMMRGGNPAFLIFYSGCLWAACAAAFALWRGRTAMPWSNWVFSPFTGSLKSLAFCSMLVAFRLGGTASVIVPIVQLSFLVTILLAAFFIRERLDGPRLAGLAFALAAVFLLSR